MGRWVESLGDQSGEGGNSGKKRVKVVAEASYATTTPNRLMHASLRSASPNKPLIGSGTSRI